MIAQPVRGERRQYPLAGRSEPEGVVRGILEKCSPPMPSNSAGTRLVFDMSATNPAKQRVRIGKYSKTDLVCLFVDGKATFYGPRRPEMMRLAVRVRDALGR